MKLTVHQLDSDRRCYREFDHYPATIEAAEGKLYRIERAFNMAHTAVTLDNDCISAARPIHDDA